MRESQEQQKRDNENSAVKPEKAPAKKHWKDDKETDHILFLKAITKNKGKQPKKRPVKSRTEKSKEIHKQYTNIAKQTTAENEARAKALGETYQTFMAVVPGGTNSTEIGNQVSLIEKSQDSDAQEKT